MRQCMTKHLSMRRRNGKTRLWIGKWAKSLSTRKATETTLFSTRTTQTIVRPSVSQSLWNIGNGMATRRTLSIIDHTKTRKHLLCFERVPVVEEGVWFQVYETVSEGTPVTPPFATLEELSRYLYTHGCKWDDKPWTRENAEAFCHEGASVPSMVTCGGKILMSKDIPAFFEKRNREPQ